MAENGGIKFAIRLYETGEEKVARQMARLDRKLQLLGGKSAAGFYSGGVFGKKVHDRFFGKGSRSFRKQVQKLMLDIAVTVTLEIISMSKGTTGNTRLRQVSERSGRLSPGTRKGQKNGLDISCEQGRSHEPGKHEAEQ